MRSLAYTQSNFYNASEASEVNLVDAYLESASLSNTSLQKRSYEIRPCKMGRYTMATAHVS